jgi:imidazolonepropionase-like amidohydrolase
MGRRWQYAALRQSGLEPRDALAAASTVARTCLGDVQSGLEEGAPADLVLYDADPRDTPEVLELPALIMFDGQLIMRRRAGS